MVFNKPFTSDDYKIVSLALAIGMVVGAIAMFIVDVILDIG